MGCKPVVGHGVYHYKRRLTNTLAFSAITVKVLCGPRGTSTVEHRVERTLSQTVNTALAAAAGVKVARVFSTMIQCVQE